MFVNKTGWMMDFRVQQKRIFRSFLLLGVVGAFSFFS
jgi:hypothetical protein